MTDNAPQLTGATVLNHLLEKFNGTDRSFIAEYVNEVEHSEGVHAWDVMYDSDLAVIDADFELYLENRSC